MGVLHGLVICMFSDCLHEQRMMLAASLKLNYLPSA